MGNEFDVFVAHFTSRVELATSLRARSGGGYIGEIWTSGHTNEKADTRVGDGVMVYRLVCALCQR